MTLAVNKVDSPDATATFLVPIAMGRPLAYRVTHRDPQDVPVTKVETWCIGQGWVEVITLHGHREPAAVVAETERNLGW